MINIQTIIPARNSIAFWFMVAFQNEVWNASQSSIRSA
jgi:hypothetical protein